MDPQVDRGLSKAYMENGILIESGNPPGVPTISLRQIQRAGRLRRGQTEISRARVASNIRETPASRTMGEETRCS